MPAVLCAFCATCRPGHDVLPAARPNTQKAGRKVPAALQQEDLRGHRPWKRATRACSAGATLPIFLHTALSRVPWERLWLHAASISLPTCPTRGIWVERRWHTHHGTTASARGAPPVAWLRLYSDRILPYSIVSHALPQNTSGYIRIRSEYNLIENPPTFHRTPPHPYLRGH